MNSTKRYLPLSLAFVLVCSVHDARANSSLDPYAHVKAPQGAQKKSAPIPSVDSITTPSTYVTMPMGGQEDPNKQGLVGTMMSTITAPHKSIKKAGSSMVSGTKTAGANLMKGSKMIGDGFAKSAGVIGQGIKSSSGKFVDGTQAVGSKIANAVPGGGDKTTPQRRSVNEIYQDRAAQELAKVDDKAAKKQMAAVLQDVKDKRNTTRQSYLSMKNKPKASSQKAPDSGFFAGSVANKAEQDRQKAIAATKKAQPKTTAAPKAIASKPVAAPSDKKWTNGFGLLKKPKLNKPSIGAGLFKKKAPAQPVQQTQVAKSNDLKPTPTANKVAEAKPATPTTTTQTHVANMNPKKKSRFGKLTKIGKGMPKLKLNPFAKTKAPQTATKQASPNL